MQNFHFAPYLKRLALVAVCGMTLSLAACGGGGGGGSSAPVGTTSGSSGASALAVSTYQVTGSVTGLSSGTSLSLLLNTSVSVTLSSTGGFSFPTQLASGATYAVTVGTQPAAQNCSITNGSGTIAINNVTNVSVTCLKNVETVLYSFGVPPDGVNPSSGLVMDASGNLYGTTSTGGGNGLGTVFRITP